MANRILLLLFLLKLLKKRGGFGLLFFEFWGSVIDDVVDVADGADIVNDVVVYELLFILASV
jgi:hypothetical protein